MSKPVGFRHAIISSKHVGFPHARFVQIRPDSSKFDQNCPECIYHSYFLYHFGLSKQWKILARLIKKSNLLFLFSYSVD